MHKYKHACLVLFDSSSRPKPKHFKWTQTPFSLLLNVCAKHRKISCSLARAHARFLGKKLLWLIEKTTLSLLLSPCRRLKWNYLKYCVQFLISFYFNSAIKLPRDSVDQFTTDPHRAPSGCQWKKHTRSIHFSMEKNSRPRAEKRGKAVKKFKGVESAPRQFRRRQFDSSFLEICNCTRHFQ